VAVVVAVAIGLGIACAANEFADPQGGQQRWGDVVNDGTRSPSPRLNSYSARHNLSRWRRLMIDMPQFSHPLQPQKPPLPRPVALTWTALTEGRWSLVVTKDKGSVAASLSPVEHACSDNREYLIGVLEDGWWLAVEVDAKLTTLASPFPSEEAAKERAEALEAGTE